MKLKQVKVLATVEITLSGDATFSDASEIRGNLEDHIREEIHCDVKQFRKVVDYAVKLKEVSGLV